MSPQGAGTWISTEMVEVNICDRWPLLVPAHRALRPEWPWWEWPRMASMRANLRTGDVLWDVGTEEGDQSAVYAQWVSGRGPARWTDDLEVGTDSKVVWRDGGIVLVEPNTLAWPNVRAIWEANDVPAPLASIVAFAADSSSSDGFVYTPGLPSCADGPLVGDHGFLHLAENGPLAHRYRLTDMARATGLRVDAITMDIEGSELVALRGANQILANERPLVWVSVHPAELAEYHGHTRDMVIDYMSASGYEHEHLAAEHEHHAFFYPTERAHDVVLPYGGDVR